MCSTNAGFVHGSNAEFGIWFGGFVCGVGSIVLLFIAAVAIDRWVW